MSNPPPVNPGALGFTNS